MSTVNKEHYILENAYLKKELEIKHKKISGSTLTNKLNGVILEKIKKSPEFTLRFGRGHFKSTVTSDELKIVNAEVSEQGDKDVLTVELEPFRVKDSELQARLVATLGKKDSFCRKHIELSLIKKGRKPVYLDSIEHECISFTPLMKSWSIPSQDNSVIPGTLMSLGQPVYIDSFYFGYEFPIALNKLEENTLTITSYSGRSISELTAEGDYVSRSAVFGVSPTNEQAKVQKSFYAYIRTISKDVKLRCQYNSWFDNMLNINVDNVTDSFLSTDKGLTRYGTRTMDSFVVDDGWNDYKSGFWSFNKKFPDKLYPFADLSESLGSSFGLWLGPRGGYTMDTPRFARKIQKAGNGYFNRRSGDICVGSDKYVAKTGELLCSFADDFRLNYFKLDGFAKAPCRNKKHDHLTKGKDDLYFFNDVWEKWTGVFEKINEKNGGDFWINLTCYAPPSPWYLQWANSLWMQISEDIGFSGDKADGDKNRLLSYRDEKYFEFYRDRQFQLPQFSLYNHDPIYGNEAKIKLSDDDFRDYLFTMAARGTGFWELYYSHNMMNEAKWRINRSVLCFLEENMDILSNSVIFGDRPSQKGVYGYSCFGKDEGILCLRNSSAEKKSFSVVLDEKIGVEQGLSQAAVTNVIPYAVGIAPERYSYGDSYEGELKGFETRILHFNRKPVVMLCDYVKAIDKHTLEVSFNQFIDPAYITCEQNEIVSFELKQDYMTVVLTFRHSFSELNEYVLEDVRDITGNGTAQSIAFDYYKHNKAECIRFSADFSVCARGVSGDKRDIMTQGTELYLGTDEQGYVHFRVGIDELVSRSKISDGSSVVAVRERNGVMKLYINGRLDSGARSLNTELTGAAAIYDKDSVELYNRALAFDEISKLH